MTTRDPSSSSCSHCESLHAALLALVTQWREMVASAFAEGPISHDEVGHVSRWTAVEMCADDLAALLAPK